MRRSLLITIGFVVAAGAPNIPPSGANVYAGTLTGALAPKGTASHNAESVDVGMPFAGKWAWPAPASPPYDDVNDSHPAAHWTPGGGDWGTDLYAPAGTTVRLRLASATGGLSYSWGTSSTGCGESTRLNIFVDGINVGWIYIAHLSGAVKTGPITNGMSLGSIANLPCNPGSPVGKHVHIEFRNPSHYSCYVDHGQPGATTLAEGTPLGVLGSNNTGPKQACSRPPSPPGSYPDGTFLRTANGAVYRVAGGAPLAIACNDLNGCDGGNWINVDQSVIDSMPRLVRDRTYLRTPEGAVYRVAGGAPLAIACNALNGCDGGNWVNISRHPIDNHDHLRTVVAEHTYLRTPEGAVYRVAGGAPLAIDCSVLSGCDGGNWINISRHPVDGHDHLRAIVADRTYLRTPEGAVYRVAGGAPLAVDCSVLDGCDRGDWVNISHHPISAKDHLRHVPADGTVIKGLPSQMLWTITGGLRGAVPPPEPSAIAVSDLAVAALPARQTFADVPTSNAFFNHIEQLYARGITNGCGQNGAGQPLFCPLEDVTRQAMAAFIIRAKGLSLLTPATPTFSDVSASHQFYGHIERMFEQGITTGCFHNPSTGERRYCPEDNVTRQAMAAFIIRAKGLSVLTPATPTFSDVPAAHQFYGHIERMFEQGITTGCFHNPSTGERRYCPDDNVTRQAMAAFLIRAFPS